MAARDILFIGVALFSLGLALYVGYYLSNTAANALLAEEQLNYSSEVRESFQSIKTQSARFDYIFFIIFIALVLSLIITGFLARTHPVFAFLYILVIILAVIVSMVLANTWETVSRNATFGANYENFRITDHILSNMPVYMAIIGGIGLFVVFAKPFLEGGGQYE